MSGQGHNALDVLRDTIGFYESCIRSREYYTEAVIAQRIDADIALARVEAVIEAAGNVLIDPSDPRRIRALAAAYAQTGGET